MKNRTPIKTSPEVDALIQILEHEGGKIEGIDVRYFDNSMFLVCECKNTDVSRFCLYLRGGSKKPEDTFLTCMTCQRTLLMSEYKAKEKAILDKYKK